jgi:hypothetical protein
MALVCSGASWAVSLIPHSLSDRYREADRVAIVQVVSQTTEAAEGDPRRLKTLTNVLVGEELKGRGAKELSVVQLGGRLGGYSAHVPGDAEFSIGETALVFLKCRTNDRCALVAFGEGKIRLSGSEAFVHDLVGGTWKRQAIGALLEELRRAAPPETSTTPPARAGRVMPTTGAQ